MEHKPARRHPVGLSEASEGGGRLSGRQPLHGVPEREPLRPYQASHTSLLDAARDGDIGPVQECLDAGMDMNCISGLQETPLQLAASRGHVAVARLLVENGANKEAADVMGHVALHSAAQRGHLPVVDMLLRAGAHVDPEEKSCGGTALHLAARHGHAAVVSALLRHGAAVDKADKLGCTALHRAAERGHVAVVQALVAGRASVAARTATGSTALHKAAEGGHVETVELLLASGADPCTETKKGRTALHRAAAKGHVDTYVKLLSASVASATAVEDRASSVDAKTSLQHAAANGHVAMVQLLLEQGADSDAVDAVGDTALHRACFNARLETAKVLAGVMQHLNCINKHGFTPVDMTMRKKSKVSPAEQDKWRTMLGGKQAATFVARWLAGLGLYAYVDAFASSGFVEREDVLVLVEGDLLLVGSLPEHHRRMILASVLALRHTERARREGLAKRRDAPDQQARLPKIRLHASGEVQVAPPSEGKVLPQPSEDDGDMAGVDAAWDDGHFVSAWLRDTVKLMRYRDAMVAAGYTTCEQIAALTEAQVRALDIPFRSHRRRLINAVRELHDKELGLVEGGKLGGSAAAAMC